MPGPRSLPGRSAATVLKLPSVEESEQQIGQQKVGNCRQKQILQKDEKGIGQIRIDGDEQILRIADGAHGAADGHGKGQS